MSPAAEKSCFPCPFACHDQVVVKPSPSVFHTIVSLFDPILHNRQVGAFGPCNVTCGGGIQNSTVGCIDQFGRAAPDAACVGSKPATEADCGTAPCDFSAIPTAHRRCPRRLHRQFKQVELYTMPRKMPVDCVMQWHKLCCACDNACGSCLCAHLQCIKQA